MELLRFQLSDNSGVSGSAFLEQNVVQLKTGANNNLNWKTNRKLNFQNNSQSSQSIHKVYCSAHKREHERSIQTDIYASCALFAELEITSFSCRLGS